MRKRKENTFKIIPLGGLGEIGKNMTIVEYKNDIVVVDCGLTFPGEDMLGVDVVIPDITYLEQHKHKIRGIVLTHGHEDHIGGIPYVMRKISTPIYCTKLTAGLLENKLKESGLPINNIRVVHEGDEVRLGSIRAEFIRVAHSIPDACAIAVKTGAGTALFTGDFKVDFTPIDGERTDIPRLAELGTEGVTVLLADSTNVERPGYTMSEKKVGETFRQIFSQAENRIIVATFASNLHRVQQIITASEKNHRKVFLTGRSMLNNVSVASELGYLKVKKGTLVDIRDVNKYKPNKITILTTGTQGEPMSALTRMANDEHRQITLNEKDTIVISASQIPGNEVAIGRIINKLVEKGCEIIYSSLADVHVSGHACQEELKLIHSVVRPKFFIPVHGEQRMLHRHAQLAKEMGMKDENILIGENGTIFQFSKNSGRIVNRIQAGNVLVDGLGVGDVGNVVLKDRKHLSEDGLISVVVTLDKKTREVVAGPEIISRGFVYVRESGDLMEGIKKVALDVMEDAKRKHITDWNYLKYNLRDQIKSYVFTEIKRDPMILSTIMEV